MTPASSRGKLLGMVDRGAKGWGRRDRSSRVEEDWSLLTRAGYLLALLAASVLLSVVGVQVVNLALSWQ